jgi:hypothetical protein
VRRRGLNIALVYGCHLLWWEDQGRVKRGREEQALGRGEEFSFGYVKYRMPFM